MTSPTHTSIGASHPRIKQFLNIKANRTGRQPTGVAVEGVWLLRAALAANAPVEVVFVAPELVRGTDTHDVVDEARKRGARVYQVSRRTIARLTERDGPDGVAAIAHIGHHTLDDIGPTTAASRIVVLDRIELAGNLGAIVRCADGAGVSAVILTDRRTRVTHPIAVKASMGTVFSMPLADATTDAAIAWIEANRLRVVAADPAATTSYRDARYDGPVAIVLGSERYGLAEAWKRHAHQLVSIPMRGTADSLNVGHAAALILYETLVAR